MLQLARQLLEAELPHGIPAAAPERAAFQCLVCATPMIVIKRLSAAKARRASGKAGAESKAEVSASLRSGPPSVGINSSAARPSGSARRKAMDRPSGDQAGWQSAAGLVVRLDKDYRIRGTPSRVLRYSRIDRRNPRDLRWKSSLYIALLQDLAFVREQEGDSDGAEAFYRMTTGYPPPDLSAVKITQPHVFGKQPSPFVGEPSLAMAAFYSNHGRIKEAEDLYRERLAQPFPVAKMLSGVNAFEISGIQEEKTQAIRL